MLTMPSFKKSLIVEQFQGNYLKESLTKLGYDQSLYGLHSFRSGGATSLAHTLENNPSK